MRAVYLQSYGERESVVVGERPEPEPGPGEVRVKIAVAGFNHVDLYMRGGGAGITHELPLTLGVDGAGVVDALGDGVTGLAVGDRVVLYPIVSCGHCEFCRRGDQMLCTSCRIWGEHVNGTFADYIVVPADVPFRIADDLSFDSAAMLPCALLTAWRMVMTQGRVQGAETVLIMGVGGGAALAAMQFSKLAGARVLVTSSSDEKLERAVALGADAGINYGREDVFKRVMALTDGRGCDVVIDNVGKATWSTSLKCAVRGGRIVNCGATTGSDPSADLQRVFIRQLRIFGSTLGNQDEFRALVRAAELKLFEPVIDRVYEMGAVRDGLERMEKGAQFGKLALRVDG